MCITHALPNSENPYLKKLNQEFNKFVQLFFPAMMISIGTASHILLGNEAAFQAIHLVNRMDSSLNALEANGP